MKLRPAIIYEDNDVFIAFDTKKFKKLLKAYLKDGDSDYAIDKIIKDLKKETKKL